MRIVIVGWGGFQKEFFSWPEYTFSDRFVRKGNSVVLYCIGERKNEKRGNIEIRRFRRLSQEFILDLRNVSCDLMHVHHFGNPLAAFAVFVGRVIKRVPTVFTSHDPFLIDGKHVFPYSSFKLIKALMKPTNFYRRKEMLRYLSFKLANVITALSPIEKQVLIRYGVPPNKIVHISNGLVLSLYEKPKLNFRSEYDLPEGPIILFVGQLAHWKGIFELISAGEKILKYCKEATFVLVTHKPVMYEEFVSSLKQKKLESSFRVIRGPLPFQHLASAYHSCDVFVLPSHTDCFPTVVLEAMTCGKPVVASRVGGIPFQVIDGKTGFLVPSLNPIALADSLIKLLKDEKLRERMGASGRERVEGLFTIERAAEKTLKLYEALLNL